ncbi:hypothetical protein FXB40_23905 [Bradyrhizobium rifense]|uniref:Uncharacterized protein n=1 Tax=Bradyrhizobium rifense TaxID=515499 RepID=A0A5D3KA09_9BRAD|nr:hypothetical protein [Bradyrhizobium rifense]TYL92738.1 hypothetical protein FXB40_23905 [Bradyrhizobium rifense]
MKRAMVAFALVTLCTAWAVGAQTTLPDRGASVDAQSNRATGMNDAGTLIQEATKDLQDKAIDRSAKAEIQKLWQNVEEVYPYLGNRGLLLEVNVVVNDASASTPSPQKQVESVLFIGVGADPAHAWAENLRDRIGPANKGYSRSLADSWFIWITPGRRGWPKSAPSYVEAASKELLDQREPRNAVVVEGTRVRGMLLADNGIRLETQMSAIAATAEAAESTATNAPLRAAAAKLRKNVEDASKRLAQINAHLEHDMRAVARAQDALGVLDGSIAFGSAASKIGDALGMLGPDAPSSPNANMTQDEAVAYVNKLADFSKRSTIEYQQQQSVVVRDINGQVDLFRHDFRSSSVALPPAN